MNIDSVLVVLVVMLLIPRVILGRPTSLPALGAACGLWALLLVTQLVVSVVGTLLRVIGLASYDYAAAYSAGSPADEFYLVVKTGMWTLFGLAVLGAVMLAAVTTPLRDAPVAPTLGSEPA